MALGPRLLRWLVTGSIFVFAALFLLLGLGAHLQLAEGRRLVEGGRQAEGIVTAAIVARRSTAARYSYRFSAGGADFTAADRSIPYGMREELRAGARVPVWYDPANPARSITRAELADLESWGNRLFFPVAGSALLAWAIARIVRAGQRR